MSCQSYVFPHFSNFFSISCHMFFIFFPSFFLVIPMFFSQFFHILPYFSLVNPMFFQIFPRFFPFFSVIFSYFQIFPIFFSAFSICFSIFPYISIQISRPPGSPYRASRPGAFPGASHRSDLRHHRTGFAGLRRLRLGMSSFHYKINVSWNKL